MRPATLIFPFIALLYPDSEAVNIFPPECRLPTFRFLRLSAIVLLLCCCVPLLAQNLAPKKSAFPVGQWDGTIQSRAGEVNFNIELVAQPGGALQATLVNATDRQPFSSAIWKDNVLTLRLDYYDGTLTLHSVSPQRMEGEYSRLTSKGSNHIPVVLVPHREVGDGKPWSGPTLDGDWAFTWSDGEGAEKVTLGSFQQRNMANAEGRAPVTGTLQPVSGDSGLLHGTVLHCAGRADPFPP